MQLLFPKIIEKNVACRKTIVEAPKQKKVSQHPKVAPLAFVFENEHFQNRGACEKNALESQTSPRHSTFIQN